MKFTNNDNYLTLIDCKSLDINHIKIEKNSTLGIVGLTGFGDEFLISIEPPPSMTQPKNSDRNNTR